MPRTESTPARLKLGIAISLVSYLFFAIASSLVYYFRGRFPTIQIIFIQNFVSLLCILPWALRQGNVFCRTKEMPLHLFRDILGVGSYFLYFLAIRYLNLVDATLLNYTAPFFIPLIWWIWQKEKIQTVVWWSIVVGFFGVIAILNPTKQIFELGFLFGLLAGFVSAIALCAVRILNVKNEPVQRTLLYYFTVGSIVSFPFASTIWVKPIAEEWALAAGIGVATAIGQILLTYAYRFGTASFLSPLGYTTVIYNAIIAFAIFNQTLGWHTFVGSALIIIGGTMTFLFRQKEPSGIA